MITFEQLRKKYTLMQIAEALGFCTKDDTFQKRAACKSRVCNWRKTGIPPRVLKKRQLELIYMTKLIS